MHALQMWLRRWDGMSRGHAQAVHMGRPKKADVRCEEDVKILSQSFFLEEPYA
jgi:hypothetical protein